MINTNANILEISQMEKNLFQNVIHYIQVGFIPEMQDWFSTCKSMNVIPISMKERENYINLSTDAEKVFDNI